MLQNQNVSVETLLQHTIIIGPSRRGMGSIMDCIPALVDPSKPVLYVEHGQDFDLVRDNLMFDVAGKK